MENNTSCLNQKLIFLKEITISVDGDSMAAEALFINYVPYIIEGALWTFGLVGGGLGLGFLIGLPCLLYTSPSPRDLSTSRMPSSA